ncbi:hypothetical protein NDU88_001271 [Pleurodeles waltl]|uniref:Uncharacterized protein n=1 Tax=Pleurodeles waltl TaxID=8319 RepID=A0AAV7NAK3_PLEWA|nr:hypothetical protein NDU88_001271 [Pleurodeles waltl]
MPHAGSAPQQGSRQPGPPLGPGAPVAHVLVASPYLRGWGQKARTHPRLPSHRPPRSREHEALHDQPCSNLQAGGGPPRLPSRGRPAPPQTVSGPTPIRAPAHSLSPAPGINAATGPRPWGSPAISNGLRQARSGLRWCSGHPHGSPLSLPVNLPRGVAQDNRRSLGPSGADGSSVRHLRLRGHALDFRVPFNLFKTLVTGASVRSHIPAPALYLCRLCIYFNGRSDRVITHFVNHFSTRPASIVPKRIAFVPCY